MFKLSCLSCLDTKQNANTGTHTIERNKHAMYNRTTQSM